jgi:hypothetical protein
MSESTGKLIGLQPQMREFTARNTAGIGGAAGAMMLDNNWINPNGTDTASLDFAPQNDQRADRNSQYQTGTKLTAATSSSAWLNDRDRTARNIAYLQQQSKSLLETQSVDKP